MVVVDAAGTQTKLRFARVRGTGLPSVEQAGDLSDLALDTDQNLAEICHVVVFSGRSGVPILGWEFNFHGPRPMALMRYLQEFSDGALPPLGVEYLLREDVRAVLDRFGFLVRLSLRTSVSETDAIARRDRSLGAALAATAELGTEGEIGLYLSVPRYSRDQRLPDRVLAMLKRLVGLGSLQDRFSQLQVTGFNRETEQIEKLDLLNTALVSEKRVLRSDARHRTVNSRDAFAQIVEAYGELRGEIDEALGVR